MRKTIIAAAILVALSSATAHAAQPNRWALDINATSYHTEAWARRQLNQDNPGAGIEYQSNSDWSALAGFYRNSYRRTTGYALASWTPLRVDLPAGLRASAGLAAGLVSGYRRDEVPTSPLAAGALLRIRTGDGYGYGANLLAVPNTTSGSGFIGLQLVIPIR